jgi:hypothetical protein
LSAPIKDRINNGFVYGTWLDAIEAQITALRQHL